MKKEGILTLLITTVIYPTPQRAVDFGNKLGVSIDNMLDGIFGFYIIIQCLGSHIVT